MSVDKKYIGNVSVSKKSIGEVSVADFSWHNFWASRSLQWIVGSVEPDGVTLSDISGNGNDALLVNSNCLILPNVAGCVGVVSANPIVDGFSCFDFSTEFTFTTSNPVGPKHILGRVNGANFHNFLSCFVVFQNKLKYYTASGAANGSVDICDVLANIEYTVKATVNNTGGHINWEVNGIIGDSAFINKTPTGLQANDQFLIGRGFTTYYALYGKLFNVKYYSAQNYVSLTNHWPCSEGYGTIGYNTVGSINLTLLAITYWSTQSTFHWNYTKGFQLYGNSDASNHLIRVPYKDDGTTLSPVIAGYTKFTDCPAGSFHNFAETGIKRNPLGDASLDAVGIDNTNVIYYGDADGTDLYSFCWDYLGEENNYVITKLPADTRALMGYPQFATYLRNGKAKRIIGASGKVHSTDIKLEVATGDYDHILRDGTYNLTDAATMNIRIPEGSKLIGESKTGTIINAELAPTTAIATIGITNTFYTLATSYSIANLTATAKNMRYVYHDDAALTIGPVMRLDNVKLQHYGNHEAFLIDPLVINTCDAYGSGFHDGEDLIATNCEFIGFVSDGGEGRGFATHHRWEAPYSDPAILRFNNCSFNTPGNYVVRMSNGPTTQLDRMEWNGCNFNGKKIYLDAVSTYDPMADKIQLYKASGDVAPDLFFPNPLVHMGLQVETGITKTLTLNAGVTKTLLLGTEKTLSAYSLTGRVNITEWGVGIVRLKGLLGDCSITPKVLSVKLDLVDTDITFDQDYSAMTNAQVLISINGINPDVQFSEYNYSTNAVVQDL